MGTLSDPPEPPATGPRVIALLPGPASAYSILSNAQGETLLVCSSDVNAIVESQTPFQIRASDSAEQIKHKLRAQYHQRAA